MPSDTPIRMAMAGLSGYAAEVSDVLLGFGDSPDAPGRLSAVYAPELGRLPDRVALLKDRGIFVTDRYEQLLEQDIDIVWLPLPIDMHRSFTETTLQAGKAVMIEKPAAGSVQDVDAMIAARDRSGQIAAVGFQDLYQPSVHELKQRLVRGEFGVILSASIIACWPRGKRYYHRNAWAGRIAREGHWILDSPANNAVAHYLHLAMFLLGADERSSAVPTEVEAELYRANPIENYDTCSLRFTFDGGSHLLAALTHACSTLVQAEIIIRTQFARIRYVAREQIEITRPGLTESLPLINPHQVPVIKTMQTWLRERRDHPIGATLEMARAHTLAMNVASQATPIIDIPADQIVQSAEADGSPLLTVPGIEEAMLTCVRRGRMLHELKAVSWSQPAGEFQVPRDYAQFPGIHP